MPEMILIIAGNMRQANHHVDVHNLRRQNRKYKIVLENRMMFGLKPTEIRLVGSWQERRDVKRMWDIIKAFEKRLNITAEEYHD